MNHNQYTINLGQTSFEKKIYNVCRHLTSNGFKKPFDISTLTGDYVAQNGAILTGTLNGNYKISIADGATVELSDVTINKVSNGSSPWAGITCLGDATIILSGENSVKGFHSDYPGIQAAKGDGEGEEYTLIISGSGKLNATSGNGAGIGGGYKMACGNIVIQGGDITATTNNLSAGIGGGYCSSCGNITITGGTVTANGKGAGIGSGVGYSETPATCGDIIITGGTVTANGTDQSAGIGASHDHSTCGNISISGGTVTATGGEKGAGIGAGWDESTCGNISISTGVSSVIVNKGADSSNNIGKGSHHSYNHNTCGTVTIGCTGFNTDGSPIGGTVYWDGSAYQNDGDTYLATSPLVYPAP